MRIELVMTIWEDGLFRMRDRIETDSFISLEAQLEVAIDNAKKKLAKRYEIAEDDDIPF